jgi:hypothetical protein
VALRSGCQRSSEQSPKSGRSRPSWSPSTRLRRKRVGVARDPPDITRHSTEAGAARIRRCTGDGARLANAHCPCAVTQQGQVVRGELCRSAMGRSRWREGATERGHRVTSRRIDRDPFHRSKRSRCRRRRRQSHIGSSGPGLRATPGVTGPQAKETAHCRRKGSGRRRWKPAHIANADCAHWSDLISESRPLRLGSSPSGQSGASVCRRPPLLTNNIVSKRMTRCLTWT